VKYDTCANTKDKAYSMNKTDQVQGGPKETTTSIFGDFQIQISMQP
jgi:hypothetical protein